MKTKNNEYSARSLTIAFVGIVVMIVIALLTSCKNYYIVVPDSRPTVIEKNNRFTDQFLEADSVFNSMLQIDNEQIDRQVKASIRKLKEMRDEIIT